MDENSTDNLKNAQLKFISTLLASVSHEFKNHLAIINESTGLIGDLMRGNQKKWPDSDRFQKVRKGIEKRVKLASRLSRHMNSFAHRMDTPCSRFSVKDVLQEEIALLKRHAEQRNVELELSLAPELPAIYNNPSLLQFVLFSLLEPLLDRQEAKCRVLVEAKEQEEGVKLTVVSEGTAPPPAAGDKTFPSGIMVKALEELGTQLGEESADPGKSGITLLVPSFAGK